MSRFSLKCLGQFLLVSCLAIFVSQSIAQSVPNQQLDEARTLLQQGKVKDAVKAFKRLDKAAKGQCTECLWALSQAYFKLEKYKDATKSCEKLLRLPPDSRLAAKAQNLMGASILARPGKKKVKAKDRKKAEDAFRAAIALYGDNPVYHFNLGMLLLREKREVEALKEFEVYQAANPTGPDAQKVKRWVEDAGKRPLLLVYVQPEYPSSARQARISGVVRLRIKVGKDGSLSEIKVLSGHPLLVQAAIQAVVKWRYRPLKLNNEPVEVLRVVEIPFLDP